jgi:hypothetical protein
MESVEIVSSPVAFEHSSYHYNSAASVAVIPSGREAIT